MIDRRLTEAIRYTYMHESLVIQLFSVSHWICDMGGTFDIAHAVKYKFICIIFYSRIIEFTKIQSLMASLFQQFSCILYLIVDKTDRTRVVVTSMASTAIPHFCCCLLLLILKKTAHTHYSLTIHMQWLKTLMIVE